MPPPASASPRRLHASWALARGVVLALGFCALYVAVDLRLADAPSSALTWPRILVGAVAWIVVAFAVGRVVRPAQPDDGRPPQQAADGGRG